VYSTTTQTPASARLSTAEAASYTGIPVSTLRYWRHNRTGPASYVIGSRVWYDVVDIDAWITEQKAATVRGDMVANGGAA